MILNNTIVKGGITPTGTISITQNGTHDVTQYASAEVNVPSGSDDPYPVRNDGKTHLWLELPSDGVNVNLVFYRYGSNVPAYLDWGDGSQIEEFVEQSASSITHASHTYTSKGNYEVKLSSSSGGYIRLGGDSSYSITGRSNWTQSGTTPTNFGSRAYLVAVEVARSHRVGSYVAMGAPCLHKVTILPETVVDDLVSGFRYCYGLREITLPATLTTIPAYMLQGCVSLDNLTIPAAVTSIGSSCLINLSSLRKLRFLSETPPTLSSTSISGLPTDCTIHVPSGTLADYQAAANYPDPATYTYVED